MTKFCSKQLLYAAVIFIGSMEIGWTITLSSPSLPLIKEEFPGLTSFETSSFQAVPALMAILGTYFANFLMLKLTRKKSLIITGVLGAIFWIALIFMNRKYFWISLIARALSGIVMGSYSTIGPVYVSEIAPPELIGFFGIMNSMMISFGHCSFNMIGAGHSWRMNVYFGAGFCLFQAICTYFIPDSPIDIKGKKEKQDIDVLNDKSNDLKTNLNSNDDENEKSDTITTTVATKSATTRRKLFQRFYLMPMFIGLSLVIMQQFAGVNAMVANMSALLHAAGLSLDSSIQASIATSAEFITGFLSAFVMDRFGRRKIFILSCCGSCLCMLLFALNDKFFHSSAVPVAVLFGYMFCFGSGFANIPWIIVPEMFDDDVRSTANSICCSMNWLSASIVTFSYPYMEKALTKFGSLIFFSTVCFAAMLFGVFLVPDDPQKYRYCDEKDETTKNLNEIEDDERIDQNLMDNAPAEL